MKAIILSVLALAFAMQVNANRGATVANFTTNQGGAFIISINGELMNRRPTTNINLNHLRPGRNNVFIEYHRGPKDSSQQSM